MRESIFTSTVRAFFTGLFTLIGVTFGLILLVIVVASMADKGTTTRYEPEKKFSSEIVANAEGERKQMGKNAPIILQLHIDGFIGSEDLNAASMRRLLIESREGSLADRVKGILLCINSPGGTVFDASSIYNSLKEYKETYKVPIYAYVDGLCASGGMYIACAADKIYSNDVSLIGSVGVLIPPFLNFSKLMDKVGIESLTLSAGKGKDDLDPLRPWKAGEEDNLQKVVAYFYNEFVDQVVANRPKVDKDKLIHDYGAQIFPPPQATNYGLIDGAGYDLKKTMEELLKAMEISDKNYQVVELHHETWYTQLFKSVSSYSQGRVVHQIQLYPDIDPNCSNQFLYLYRP